MKAEDAVLTKDNWQAQLITKEHRGTHDAKVRIAIPVNDLNETLGDFLNRVFDTHYDPVREKNYPSPVDFVEIRYMENDND